MSRSITKFNILLILFITTKIFSAPICQVIDHVNGTDRYLPVINGVQIGQLSSQAPLKKRWCKNYLRSISGNLICSFNGSYSKNLTPNIVPYDINTGKKIKNDQVVFSSAKKCSNYIQHIRQSPQTIITPLTNQAFSFNKYSPNRERINQISYPRERIVLYRGVEPSLYPLKKVISSILNPNHFFIESMLFSAIKYKLKKEYNLSKNNYIKKRTQNDWWRTLQSGININHLIESILDQRKNPLTEKEASFLTKKIIDHTFIDEAKNRNSIETRILDYNSVNYSDFPRDVVFTSYYPDIASIYGATVLVFKENPDNIRSIDLTFWNYKKSGQWHGRGDSGEFISPGYISPKEVMGAELHSRGNYPDKSKQFVPFKDYLNQRYEPIIIALYKLKIDGENLIIVLDGMKKNGSYSNCIRQSSSNKKYFFCKQRDTTNSNQSLTKLTKEEVPIFGFLKLCKKKSNCKLSKKVKKIFTTKSKRTIPRITGHPYLLNEIKKIKIMNKSVYFLNLKAGNYKK